MVVGAPPSTITAFYIVLRQKDSLIEKLSLAIKHRCCCILADRVPPHPLSKLSAILVRGQFCKNPKLQLWRKESIHSVIEKAVTSPSSDFSKFAPVS